MPTPAVPRRTFGSWHRPVGGSKVNSMNNKIRAAAITVAVWLAASLILGFSAAAFIEPSPFAPGGVAVQVGWLLLLGGAGLAWMDAYRRAGRPSRPAPSRTKTCPACAEPVMSAARICRFCQYSFTTIKEEQGADAGLLGGQPSPLPGGSYRGVPRIPVALLGGAILIVGLTAFPGLANLGGYLRNECGDRPFRCETDGRSFIVSVNGVSCESELAEGGWPSRVCYWWLDRPGTEVFMRLPAGKQLRWDPLADPDAKHRTIGYG